MNQQRDGWQIASEVWSATSFSEPARDAREAERFNRLHPEKPRRLSHAARYLAGAAPMIAASERLPGHGERADELQASGSTATERRVARVNQCAIPLRGEQSFGGG